MDPVLPRVAITYCTQCKWMLRAAYFGQELLSTFGTTIGEIALIPATGGIFTVVLRYEIARDRGAVLEAGEGRGDDGAVEVKDVLLWDRKSEGGFPETKILKQRVRDHLDPKKNLGHSDTPSKHGTADTAATEAKTSSQKEDAVVVQATNTHVGPQQKNDVIADPEKAVKRNADGTVCEDCG